MARSDNALPRLPPDPDVETRAILKACIEARIADISGFSRVFRDTGPAHVGQHIGRQTPGVPATAGGVAQLAHRTLCRVAREHLEMFRAQSAGLRDGEGLARLVREESRAFLWCGWLAGGFVRSSRAP